jgi:hypothetical protein
MGCSVVKENASAVFNCPITLEPSAGQFRGSAGMIMREGAVFVILLYPAGNKDSSTRIEEIRDIYRKTFAQESVMRIDGESCVSF